MPGLTVTEKEHWKDRIARKIDKRIETIATEEPNLLERVQRQARQRSLESLGIADLEAELDQVERSIEAEQKREQRLEKERLARIRGVPVEEVENYSAYQHEQEISNAIDRRQSVFEDELLAQSEVGRRILQLRLEKENLQDVIWLATSAVQVKALWTKVSELLGEQPTSLERDALAIEPVQD